MSGIGIIYQVGIFILMVALIIGFIYLVIMLSRELHEQKRDLSDLRKEFIESIGPNFDQITEIMKNQDKINNELVRQMNTQTRVLSEISELKSKYLEMAPQNKTTDSIADIDSNT